MYRRTPGLGGISYASQYERFVADSFHWIGAWETALGHHGYEVLGILANVKPLQRAWAAENNAEWREIGWQTRIALTQLKKFRPDVLLLYEATGFDESWLRQLRAVCPSLRLVLGFSASPSGNLETLRSCDLVLSSCLPVLRKAEAIGCRTQMFPHAFNPAVLAQLPAREPVAERILFSGGIVRADGYHFKREIMLEALVGQVPIILQCPQAETSLWHDFADTAMRRVVYLLMQSLAASGMGMEKRRRFPVIGRAAKWTSLPQSQINSRLRPSMAQPFFGIEMMKQLRSAAVALNDHGEICEGYTSNMRMFEGTGVGSCLLTDATLDLHDYFEPDREVVTYSSAEECVEKARWLLDHPTEREEIARAGQRRTLRDHTYANRAALLHELIGQRLQRS
jgi:hypothetical protein